MLSTFMRILTYNVNGIRSAINKGFLEWLAADPADIICLQEVKACETDVDCSAFHELGYHHFWFPAQKKGYSGVAILSKTKPDAVHYGDGRAQSDEEGRVLRTDFPAFSVINAYFPSGTTGDVRQAYKYQWLDEFLEQTLQWRQTMKPLIICGDYNIAHREIDIHNPVSNKNSSGFLPEERAWLDRFFDAGFIDTFRHLNEAPDHYSWWSYRAAARKRNKGWRIDYISACQSLKDRIRQSAILPDVVHSDHCPVRTTFEF